MMDGWIKKTVVAMLAGLGSWLVATGVVDAQGWAQVTGEPVVVAIAGVVTVVFYGVINRLSDWVAGIFKAE